MNSQTGDGEPGLSVAHAATAVGLTPATVRTWDHRYQLSPSLRTPGGHRRYSSTDLQRLRLAAQLVNEGAPPSSAVPTVRALSPAQCEERLAGYVTPTVATDMPTTSPDDDIKAMLRACRVLDTETIRSLVTSRVRSVGVVATWETMIAPFLSEVGSLWESGRIGVDAEHAASRGISEALLAFGEDQLSQRPVLLVCAPEEQHTLGLLALRAALTEVNCPAYFLGARVPVEALLTTVNRLRPRAVIIWASTSETASLAELAIPRQRPPIDLYLAGAGWPKDVTTPVLADLPSAVQRLTER